MNIVKMAESSQEIGQYCLLREKLFRDKLGIDVDQHDVWDEDAIVFVAVNNEKIVGGCRMVLASGKHGLPMEHDGIDISKLLTPGVCRKSICEISRLIMDPCVADKSLLINLFLEAEKWAKDIGMKTILGFSPKVQARMYQRVHRKYELSQMGNTKVHVFCITTFPEKMVEKYNGIVDSIIKIDIID